MSFPGGSNGKEFACSVRDYLSLGWVLSLGWEDAPGGGHGKPL